MKLHEITKGPGDYWAGDEHNPRSPDYDENAGRRGRGEGNGPDHSDYMSPRDSLENKRSRGVQNRTQKVLDRTKERFESGEKNGKPYNVVVTFTGDNEYEAQRMVDSWNTHNLNVCVKHQPVVEYNGAVATMYVMMDRQHFTHQRLTREQQ